MKPNRNWSRSQTLLFFFHDYLVNGYDASIIFSSTPFNPDECDIDINLSLPSDAFDVVIRTKTTVKLAYPNIVLCVDILAVATRNLMIMVSDPY